MPDVKITDYKGEVYYELMGYYGTKDMENYLSGIPENPGDLYQNLDFENEKVPTDEELMLLSGSYQSLAQRSTNRTIKHEFINFSNNLFNKCIKTCKNQDFIEKSYLSKSFNSVLLKSSGKAIREIDITRISDNNKPYALYILANAHLDENNAAEAEKLIREIEQTGNQQWISYAHLLKKKYAR